MTVGPSWFTIGLAGGFSEQRLELGEIHFHRVEVGAEAVFTGMRSKRRRFAADENHPSRRHEFAKSGLRRSRTESSLRPSMKDQSVTRIETGSSSISGALAPNPRARKF